MNRREAFIALAEGKKITREDWEYDGYVYINPSDCCIYDEAGDCICEVVFTDDDEYSIYEDEVVLAKSETQTIIDPNIVALTKLVDRLIIAYKEK